MSGRSVAMYTAMTYKQIPFVMQI